MTPIRRSSATLLAVAVLVTACQPDQSTAPDAAVLSVSTDVSAAGGAAVIRGQTLSFLAHLDAERGLLSIHAPSNLCTVGDVNVNDFQFVITPSAIEQFIAQLRSNAEQVAVYGAGSFAEAGMVGTAGTAGFGGIVDVAQFCGFLAGPTLIAEGTVRRISNLSNANFVARWTGTLTATDGTPTHLTEVYQLRADAQDPNNPATWVVDVSKVLLH